MKKIVRAPTCSSSIVTVVVGSVEAPLTLLDTIEEFFAATPLQ